MRPQGLLHRRHEIRIFPWQLSRILTPGEILRPPDRWTHHLRRRRVFQALFEKFFHTKIETIAGAMRVNFSCLPPPVLLKTAPHRHGQLPETASA